MATIDIGGRKLDVRPHTLGLQRKVLLPIEERQDKAIKAQDRAEIMACDLDVFLAFVGHNEGVTREWLEEVLPVRMAELVSALLAAAGIAAMEAQKAPGEAARP